MGNNAEFIKSNQNLHSKYDNINTKRVSMFKYKGLFFEYQNSRNIFNNYNLKILNVDRLN